MRLVAVTTKSLNFHLVGAERLCDFMLEDGCNLRLKLLSKFLLPYSRETVPLVSVLKSEDRQEGRRVEVHCGTVFGIFVASQPFNRIARRLCWRVPNEGWPLQAPRLQHIHLKEAPTEIAVRTVIGGPMEA